MGFFLLKVGPPPWKKFLDPRLRKEQADLKSYFIMFLYSLLLWDLAMTDLANERYFTQKFIVLLNRHSTKQ